jgi:hydroxypyruvate reductase
MLQNEIEILVVGPQLPDLMEALEQTFRVHKLWLIPEQGAFLKEIGPGIRGMLTSFVYGANAELIEALPKLEIIANYGVGIEKINLEAAFNRNIPVTNTPDISEPVADLAMTLLLTVARRVCEADRFVRRGQWIEGAFPFSTHVGGKTCGIVGLGRIGRAVARRAEAFGMHIAYHGPRRKQDVAYPYYEDLKTLARESNFLVLCLPGGEETKHIINAEILAALGSEGYLINMARGSVLDEEALIRALQSGQIAGAGLDVFEAEPLASSPLMAFENVVLLPHISSATVETRHAMGEVVLANLQAHFAGQPLKTPVVRG